MRGLDPHIHPLREKDGSPGQARSSPAMTVKIQNGWKPL
jgi:hypothetical protein